MAKEFAARVSKKDRKTVDMSSLASRDIYKMLEEKSFLKGAELEILELLEIEVRDQVRTKFNDASLRELADNIRINGLIQPLVVHREKGKYVLVCGERRFRAMQLIDMKEAPCFVLSNKDEKELMAIQFSENSSREQLHYIDKADGIYNYQKSTNASERMIVDALGVSKTEVHRALMIAKVPARIKEAAKEYDIEKYVLLEWDALPESEIKIDLASKICSGLIVKRSQLKKAIQEGLPKEGGLVEKQSSSKQKQMSADQILSAMRSKLEERSIEIDSETLKLLSSLVRD